jgi:ornithine carbamoyltransferase|tara:strand:- start:1876 stop:2781 length:906 start_codon:yes stop_codon:yes gene_type:complete
MTAMGRHFLNLDVISKNDLRSIIDTAKDLKNGIASLDQPLAGKALAMIFEKPSTRTRVSFEIGMKQLGGDVVVLNSSELQIGRGETIADTAKVLSRYVDCIMMRTYEHEKISELAKFSTVPVINGLTNSSHPCQLLADVMTFEEHVGPIQGKTIAWSGDGNNMASSWIHAAVKFDFNLRIACPKEQTPHSELFEWANKNNGSVELFNEPSEAIKNADCVVTDTWTSMGDNAADPHNHLAPFQVDKALMSHASVNAVFMHCLPAHRGEEVTSDVIDGPQSIVWDEAENRLHTQKAILLWCLK